MSDYLNDFVMIKQWNIWSFPGLVPHEQLSMDLQKGFNYVVVATLHGHPVFKIPKPEDADQWLIQENKQLRDDVESLREELQGLIYAKLRRYVKHGD